MANRFFLGVLGFFLVFGSSPGAAKGAGPVLEHVVVYHEPGRFGGWPANSGVWSWGNEIVVGFALGYYQEKGDDHSRDESKPIVTALARSRDSGRTWTVEEHPELGENNAKPSPGGIKFNHPDFAMRLGNDYFLVSYDRGRSWQGPYRLPDFRLKGKLTARTDYIVTGEQECLLFLSAKDDTVQAGIQDRAFMARTSDGGKTFQFVAWMTDAPRSVRSVMPSTVKVGPSQLVSVLRRRLDPPGDGPRNDLNWIDAYGSNDGGQSWEFLRRVAFTDLGLRNGNPPSLVRLPDSRLCVAYGFRGIPYGIRAKISRDNGKTWGPEIHLRDDARTWDMGYTRSVALPDGKVVTIYYYTTAQRPEQHLEATIWDPAQVE